MMQCQRCGKQIPTSVAFCAYCGLRTPRRVRYSLWTLVGVVLAGVVIITLPLLAFDNPTRSSATASTPNGVIEPPQVISAATSTPGLTGTTTPTKTPIATSTINAAATISARETTTSAILLVTATAYYHQQETAAAVVEQATVEAAAQSTIIAQATQQAQVAAQATQQALDAQATQQAQPQNTIANFRVIRETPSSLTFAVDYSYIGAPVSRLSIGSGCPSRGIVDVSCNIRGMDIPGGQGTAEVEISYTDPDRGLTAPFTSQVIRAVMIRWEGRSGSPLVQVEFNYTKTWSP